MTSEEIRANIRNCDVILDQFYKEKNVLEQELDELDKLKNKFATLQNDFVNSQKSRLGKMAIYFVKSIQNNIFKKYYEGMNEFLSGREFVKAYDGLSEAKQKISNKMRELLETLDTCENNIVNKTNERNYWQSQLGAVLEAEAAVTATEVG